MISAQERMTLNRSFCRCGDRYAQHDPMYGCYECDCAEFTPMEARPKRCPSGLTCSLTEPTGNYACCGRPQPMSD